jgi:hypothetical protein
VRAAWAAPLSAASAREKQSCWATSARKISDARATELRTGGYIVETCVVDAMDRDSVRAFAEKAASLGEVKYFIDTAGASPNQTSPEHIVALDLVATSYAIDEFARVIARGGAGSGYFQPDRLHDGFHAGSRKAAGAYPNRGTCRAGFCERRTP